CPSSINLQPTASAHKWIETRIEGIPGAVPLRIVLPGGRVVCPSCHGFDRHAGRRDGTTGGLIMNGYDEIKRNIAWFIAPGVGLIVLRLTAIRHALLPTPVWVLVFCC